MNHIDLTRQSAVVTGDARDFACRPTHRRAVLSRDSVRVGLACRSASQLGIAPAASSQGGPFVLRRSVEKVICRGNGSTA